MTVLPEPLRLLTVAEYLELDEPELGYSELVEGRLLMSPSPVPDHNRAVYELGYQLRGQLPDELEALPDVDVDLQLVPPEAPGLVRRPDLVILDRAARTRVRIEGGVIRASEVLIVVEVVSPGSMRTDYRTKRDEYADAGIPHYWIIDLDPPTTLLACHLAGELGYADDGAVTGRYAATTPFPAEIDLDALR